MDVNKIKALIRLAIKRKAKVNTGSLGSNLAKAEKRMPKMSKYSPGATEYKSWGLPEHYPPSGRK